MSTLDRYIFQKAFLLWLFTLLSLTGLIILAQSFGSISMFSEHDTSLSTILIYMCLRIPGILYLIIPFALCLGILATQALFSRHVETIAMQAASVSDRRLYLPYLALGLLATLLMGGLSFSVYPLAQKQAERVEALDIRQKDITGSFSADGCRFQAGGAIYYAEILDIPTGRMQNVSCYRMQDGKIATILTARQATWDGKAWRAVGMREIVLNSSRITTRLGDGILPLTNAPTDLVTASATPDVLTLGELRYYLTRLDAADIHSRSLETTYHNRISFTFAPLIMTLLVLPFGMRFPRTGGIARGITLGLILGLLYWGLHSGMITAGQGGYVRPVLAAWSINCLALITAMILIYKRRGTYG